MMKAGLPVKLLWQHKIGKMLCVWIGGILQTESQSIDCNIACDVITHDVIIDDVML